MRIAYLELANYRRFKELKLQFPDGIVGILGLNGSGKTTIIEAIAWALFGNEEEVVRTSRESIKFSGAGPRDSVRAVLEFELDDAEYRLEREMGGRSLGMKVVLSSGGGTVAEGDKPVRAAVQRLIGMDYRAFFTSVFARQKELDDLQEMQPARRKEIVLRMLRIDGIDVIIRSIRSDGKAASDRIRGAEGLLLDEQGGDREASVAARAVTLGGELATADKALAETQRLVDRLAKEVGEAREQRDALKKDRDELNAVTAESKATARALEDRRAAGELLAKRVDETEKALRRLPELERAEDEWRRASDAKDSLEMEKARFERREQLRKDMEEVDAEVEATAAKIMALAKSISEEKDAEEKMGSAEKDRAESVSASDTLTEKIVTTMAVISERKEALAARVEKLGEVESTGEKGACPTCERPLEGAYPMLTAKLRKEIEDARHQIEAEERLATGIQEELKALESRIVALDEELEHQEARTAKLKKDSARMESLEDELSRIKARREERVRAIDEIGDISYSAAKHAAAREAFDRLSAGHDEFLRLSETRNQLGRTRGDLDGHRAAIERLKEEARSLSEAMKRLEPQKARYEEAQADLDRKSEELVAVKGSFGDAKARAERLRAEMEATRRELETIRRSKDAIEELRNRMEELGAIEEVFVSFKNHLISRIAPTLSEGTSDILALMTDGKYGEVSLDDNYQMSIEDGGEFHRLDRFSGGEADIANLSLRLAISRVVAERTGANQVNVLILDEIFGSLDPSRKRSVMTALSGLSTQFRQVMLITHVEDVKDLLANVISVEELPDGTSTARVVS